LLSNSRKVKINRTVILHVAGYECETWTLTFREEHKLRVFENWVLRKISGAKRDEVTGEWRKRHHDQLHELYSSPNTIKMIKSRRMTWAGYVAHKRKKRNVYRTERAHLEVLCIHWRIVLKWILNRLVRHGLDLSGSA
jgi:hypothetical protein